jgi:serine/threonine protein kinase
LIAFRWFEALKAINGLFHYFLKIKFAGEEIDDCMMISDGAAIILSDDKPYNVVMKDDEGHIKRVSSYSILMSLSQGSTGETLVGAAEVSDRERVALKCVMKSALSNLVDVEQAAQEYKVLSSLNHRNIIKAVKVSYYIALPTHLCTTPLFCPGQ